MIIINSLIRFTAAREPLPLTSKRSYPGLRQSNLCPQILLRPSIELVAFPFFYTRLSVSTQLPWWSTGCHSLQAESIPSPSRFLFPQLVQTGSRHSAERWTWNDEWTNTDEGSNYKQCWPMATSIEQASRSFWSTLVAWLKFSTSLQPIMQDQHGCLCQGSKGIKYWVISLTLNEAGCSHKTMYTLLNTKKWHWAKPVHNANIDQHVWKCTRAFRCNYMKHPIQ